MDHVITLISRVTNLSSLMGRPRSHKAAATEVKIKEALQGIKDGIYKSAYDASKQLNLNNKTLNNRLTKKTKSRVEAREGQQILSKAEEQALVRWVTQITRSGHPARHPTVREMAEALRMQRHCKVDNCTEAADVKLDRPLGQQWVNRFLKRHPELQTIPGRTIEGSRVKESSEEKLTRWFNEFKRVIDEYKVDPKNIYNMDETGFSIGTMQASVIIINKAIRTQFQAAPGRQEWVSIVECVSMDGRAISPMTIYKGERLSNAWIPDDADNTWIFSCNSKGWTSNVHGLEWLRRCFEPQTRECANNGKDWRILVCDGHESHVTSSFLAHCL
jgi:DDE superfamily endonuclease/Tc5 transposase DNA-binding domain